MAYKESNVQLYMETLAKTATKGNVTVAVAWLANRMELFCHKCQQTLTAPKPEDETVDYAVQEFLKLHLHKAHATWCACEKCHAQEAVGYQTYVMGMTADFKKPGDVTIKNIAVPTNDEYGLTNLPKAAKTVAEPAIDKNPVSAGIIKAKMAAFKQEYAAKSVDQATINKIKVMQLNDLAKAKQGEEAKTLWTYYNANYVQKNYNNVYTSLPGQSIYDPEPEPKKDKPLKQKTGRKFR